MAIEKIAGKMVNKISFSVDSKSLKAALASINKVKKALGGVTGALDPSGLAGSRRTINRAMDAHVKAKQKLDSQVAKAHDRALLEDYRRTRANDQRIVRERLRQAERERAGMTALERKAVKARIERDLKANRDAAKRRFREQQEIMNRGTKAAITESRFAHFASGLDLSPRQLQQFQARMRQLNQEFRAGTTAGGVSGYREQIRQLQADMRRTSASATNMTDVLHNARSAFIAATASGTLFAGGMSVIDVGKQFQALKITAGVAFGEGSADQIRFLSEESERLGVRLLDVGPLFTKFSLAAKSSGVTLEDQRKIFSRMSEAAAVFHMTPEKTKLAFNAINQMASKGVVTYEDLRNQLAEHLPDAVGIFQRAMKMDSATFRKAVESRKILASDLSKFADELGRTIAPGLEKALHSLNAEQGRLTNNLDRMRDTLFTGGLERGTKRVIELFNMLIDMTDRWLKSGWATFIGSTIEGFSLSAELAFALIHDAVVAMSNGWGLLFESMGMTKKTADELKAMFMDKGGLIAGGLLFLYVLGRILAVFKGIRNIAALIGLTSVAGAAGAGAGAGALGVLRLMGPVSIVAGAVTLYSEEIKRGAEALAERKKPIKDFFEGLVYAAVPSTLPTLDELSQNPSRFGIESATSSARLTAGLPQYFRQPTNVFVSVNAEGLKEYFDVRLEKNNKDIGWSVLKSIPSN